jgi:hypothetical protein
MAIGRFERICRFHLQDRRKVKQETNTKASELNMGAVQSSVTSVNFRGKTRRYFTQNRTVLNLRRENLSPRESQFAEPLTNVTIDVPVATEFSRLLKPRETLKLFNDGAVVIFPVTLQL